jgi:hypothetical protein
MHYYTGTGLTNPAVTGNWGTLAQQQEQWTRFQQSDGPATIIGTAIQYVRGIEANNTVLQGRSIWVTEFNVIDRVGTARHTWALGLANAAMYLETTTSTALTTNLMTHHTLYSDVFGASFRSTTEMSGLLINPGYSVSTTPNVLDGTGRVFEHISKASEGATSARRFDFATAPNVSFGQSGDTFKALSGIEFDSVNGKRLVLFNFSDQSLSVSLTSFQWEGQYFWEALTGDPRRHILSQSDLVFSSGFALSATNLAPYSVTVLTPVPEPSGLLWITISFLLASLRLRREIRKTHTLNKLIPIFLGRVDDAQATLTT